MSVYDLEYWKELAIKNAERANMNAETAIHNAKRSDRYYCLLMDEHHLRTRNTSPWDCEGDDCPYTGKPMAMSCKCFADRYAQHMRQIATLPGEAE